MTALLLAPHADDETLFAFYQLLRDKPFVVVVLNSGAERKAEFAAAMEVARIEPERWITTDIPEDDPEWVDAALLVEKIVENVGDVSNIIAPAYEEGGHEHHNEVALIAATLGKPLTSYYTYVRGSGRTARGTVVVASAAERELKRRAMDCYASQIADPKTAPWFGTGWQLEYVESR